MRLIIRAEIRGRIRVHADIEKMSLAEADILEYYLKAVPGVTRVKVFDRTRDAVIEFTCDADVVKEALARFCFTDENAKALVPEHTSRVSDRESEDLNALLLLRDISNALMRRTGRDYRVIISFNSLLIALGAFGIIAPSTLAMLHNISTIGISIYNMTDLIKS